MTTPENKKPGGTADNEFTEHDVASLDNLKTDPDKNKQTVLESHGYTIGVSIGKGSYATVKSGYSEKHEMKVAIKIVSKMRAPEDYLRKFLPREIEVVKGLKHHAVINFLQAIETTHRVYLIMELAENGNLLDYIRQNKFIREPQAKQWFYQLTDAIDYCHEKGVVHRDIKCENLLLDIKYRLKVTDFGFARGNMKPSKEGNYPLSETFCGSYAYASPEILRGIPYAPQLSDVWSMGVVLFAMVFGRLPFDDTNHKTLLKQVQSEVVFPLEPSVSAGLRTVLTRIFRPARIRLTIPQIRLEPWYHNFVPEDDESDNGQPTTSAAARIPSKEGGPSADQETSREEAP